jgi:cytochrome bd-type quinol oxidase subunit 1
MKRSVKVAAKTVNIALIVVLVSAFGLAAVAACHGMIPKTSEKLLDRVTDFLGSALALGFVVAVVSGFHIAVSAAMDRMKDKSASGDEKT